MGLRRRRGSGRGRAALGRPAFVALACSAFLAAGLASTAPALRDAASSYLAWGERPAGAVSPGDHLQTTYHLWLVGHQLERGAAPWRDPYSFRPAVSARPSFAGWPFGLPFWPLERLFGPVVAWNLLVLLAYVAAGGLACAWLRALGVPRAAAVAGGVAFALAPYRVAQTAGGHLLGLVAVLLPLALYAVERGRAGGRGWGVLAVAATASIPLSGQVHFALGAVPFLAAYALWRSGAALAAAALASGATAGLLVYATLIAPSAEAAGRSLAEVARYSATPADFVSRSADHGLERLVLVGWLTPVLALAGLVLLLAARRLALAALLGAAATVPALLALGTNLPGYELLWRHVEPFRYPRVPERLMPLAALALAALAAFALARLRRPSLALVAVPLVALDLWVGVFAPSRADDANTAYAALRLQPAGRVLELPAFRPDRYLGSVYLHYAVQAPRERPGGYSTLAPPEAGRALARARPLNCGGGPDRLLEHLGVRYVAVHRRLYAADGLDPACAARARERLEALGFRRLARDRGVELLGRR
jgi:hypothetical protein